jgi:hypothetical protein
MKSRTVRVIAARTLAAAACSAGNNANVGSGGGSSDSADVKAAVATAKDLTAAAKRLPHRVEAVAPQRQGLADPQAFSRVIQPVA